MNYYQSTTILSAPPHVAIAEFLFQDKKPIHSIKADMPCRPALFTAECTAFSAKDCSTYPTRSKLQGRLYTLPILVLYLFAFHIKGSIRNTRENAYFNERLPR